MLAAGERARRGVILASALGAVAIWSWAGRVFDIGPVDDAFISLRYAANWANGRGLSFNPGERVEGFTSFLWVALEAIAIRLGLPAETAMRWLGMASLAALAAAVGAFAQSRLFGSRAVPAVAAALLVSLNPVVFCWAASGMESVLYAFFVLAALVSCLGGASARPATAGALLLLAATTRPEAVALFPVLLLLIWLETRARVPVARFAGTFCLGFSAYFAARAAYFGYLFPNTFYAKLDYGSAELAIRGAGYAGRFALAVAALAVCAVAALLPWRRAPGWVRAFWLVTAVQLAVVVYEGGDHFAMYRFLVPVVAPLTLLALEPFSRTNRRPRVAAAVGLALVGLSDWTAGFARFDGKRGTELGRFRDEVRLAELWSGFGRGMRSAAGAGASLSTIAIGAVGFYSDLRIVDPHGIVEPAIAHLRRELGHGYAGHEKFDTAFVFWVRPSYLLLLNLPSRRPLPEAYARDAAWGAFNGAMMRDPRLAQHYRYETVRFGGLYWSLHVRRDLAPLPGGETLR